MGIGFAGANRLMQLLIPFLESDVLVKRVRESNGALYVLDQDGQKYRIDITPADDTMVRI